MALFLTVAGAPVENNVFVPSELSLNRLTDTTLRFFRFGLGSSSAGRSASADVALTFSLTSFNSPIYCLILYSAAFCYVASFMSSIFCF